MRTLLALLLLTVWSPVDAIDADEVQARRIRGGLRLFRAILAADEDIADKTTSEGALRLIILHAGDVDLAEEVAEELRTLGKGSKRGHIRKIPIDVQVSDMTNADALADIGPAGVFLVENLPDGALAGVVAFGVQNQIIVYSPFEGDVDRGVLAGLAIETRVRPYINLKTMRDSGIRIKAFFLKVAKHYDP